MDDIHAQVADLNKEQAVLSKQIKALRKKSDDIEDRIKSLTLKYPTCYSCGNHYHPKYMVIATQEDVNEYTDNNEGYCGPETGEYYCGC